MTGFLLPLALAMTISAGGGGWFGPIAMKNHHPLYSAVLSPSPEQAAPADNVHYSLAVNHSNIYLIHIGDRWGASVDKEISEFDFALRLPVIKNRLEIGVEAPVYTSSGGFMDGVTRKWHDAVGVNGYRGQKQSPDFRFLDKIYYNGRVVMSGQERVAALTDMRFWLKGAMLSGDGYIVSIQAVGSAPTGSADAGTGSGQWASAGRLLATVYNANAAAHFGAGAIFPGKLNYGAAPVTLDNMFTAFAGLELYVTRSLHLVVQSTYTTTPLRGADIYEFNRDWVESTIGLKYKFANGAVVSAGMSENINQTAPDYTLHLSLEM